MPRSSPLDPAEGRRATNYPSAIDDMTGPPDVEVRVLKRGYSRRVGPNEDQSCSTITLVRDGDLFVLVDAGCTSTREELGQALRRHHVRPEQISYLVVTDAEPDHLGGMGLFLRPLLVMGNDIAEGDLNRIHDYKNGRFEITPNIHVISTPGHGPKGLSVIVHAREGVYAIVGDLYEDCDDEETESWRAFSLDPSLQQRSRSAVREIADFIIPGHGDVFPNPTRVAQGLPRRPALPQVAVDRFERAISGLKEGPGSKAFWLGLLPFVVAVLAGLLVWWITARLSA